MAVKWAPSNTPLPRRRQTATVLLWIFLMPILVALYFILLFTWTSALPILLAYGIFVAFDPAPEMGGRRIHCIRQWKLWTYLRDYFPMKLVKTSEIDPTKNYVFGYHPHGIIALGAFTNFGTEANLFSDLFPGIKLSVLTLGTNFVAPFWRELLLSLGFCSVSKKSCENILSEGPGRACMIVVGGASEAIYAYPTTCDLVLKRRFGFVKLAIRHGADLVPVIAFGENDLWNQIPNPDGSLIRKFQKLFQKIMAFTPIFFHGRGIFQYSIGIMPHRKTVTTVVGSPISMPFIAHPDKKTVEKFHDIYVKALFKLYDDHKEQYAINRTKEMSIVE